MTYEEAVKHFRDQPTQELIDFTDNKAFQSSRYLFITKVSGSMYKGYCTHCNKTGYIDGPIKHNQKTRCPNCHSICLTKQAGRSRGQMVDVAYVEFCEKSLVDPDAITFSGYYVMRDYRDGYLNIQTSFMRLAMYIFKPNESYMFSRTRWDDYFTERKSIFSLHATTAMGHLAGWMSRRSIKAAIKGTPFQYSMVTDYLNHQTLPYLTLYCKYPYVEVLHKIGLKNVIQDRLDGVATNQVINWRGKTLDAIIRLSKSDWKHFRHFEQPLQTNHLHIIQKTRTSGINLPISQLYEIIDKLDWHHNSSVMEEIMQAIGNVPIDKLYRYVMKQFEQDAESYYSLASVLYTWRDYLKECIAMNVDVKNVRTAFPKSVHTLHQRQIERKKVIAAAKRNGKFKKRARELSSLCYEFGGLHMRPVASGKELTREGLVLHHCVADYAERHTTGETSIFVIRKNEAPHTPFYTLELGEGKYIKQIRGKNNSSPTDEVQAFLDAFTGIATVQATG